MADPRPGATAPIAVLHVNHTDTGHGGAAAAALRLHQSLLAIGVDSRIAVGTKESADALVEEVPRWPRAQRQLRRIGWRAGLNEIEGVGAFGLTRRPSFRDADVVHFHALQGGWFSYPSVPWLTRRTPAVLTLHDMWPLTGHCSFSLGCERWRSGCGSCPHPDTFPAIQRDATHLEWLMKRALWARSDILVVAPSRWMASLVGESILKQTQVRMIPYGLDLEVFAPRDRPAGRARLGLPSDAVVVLYAAASVADSRKGADLVPQVLGAVPADIRTSLVVVLMGDRSRLTAAPLRALGYTVFDLGYVPDDDTKAAAYSSADLLIFPTRADNSPLVVLESLACGTPVVTFDVGGLAETVRDGETGFVVAPEDVAALTAAVIRLVSDAGLRAAIRPRCRAHAAAHHERGAVARAHEAVYREAAEVRRTRSGEA
jgi:glycosyltransferase involved in cell wall biosynthesis